MLNQLFLLGGLLLGALVGWFLGRAHEAKLHGAERMNWSSRDALASNQVIQLEDSRRELGRRVEQLERDLREALEKSQEAHTESAKLGERASRVEPLEDKIEALEGDLKRSEQANANINAELSGLTSKLEAEQQQNTEKLSLLEESKALLLDQFKNLANEILEDKSKRFTEQNQTNIGVLLEPFKTKIQEFKEQVESTYDKESRDRIALAEQVRQLMDLNQVISTDAKNLTQALTGSSKTQGNWGELVLERILENSGLRKGEEFVVQDSHTSDEGNRLQPDVVIHLPEDRHLVVDSKVSLLAFQDFALAESEDLRSAALKRHLISVRTHIKGLSEKNYQVLHSLRTLDFVLMFIPIEPAFMAALTGDSELFMEAYRKNVLLVSPSTLMFVLRTVAHLWRQEAQTRNTQEIVIRGAKLYDELCGFVQELEKVGDRLKQAQESYDSAKSKLHQKPGNVVRQAELLKGLGVKPTKTLPTAMTGATIEAPTLPEVMAPSIGVIQAED